MPCNWVEVDVHCPFYRRIEGRSLCCEGPWQKTGVRVSFPGQRAMTEHMQRLCQGRFCQCPLYQAAQARYESE